MSIARYPNYKDSGVEFLGDVPAHWEVKRLKNTADVFPSNVDKRSVEGQITVKLCNYTDVYYNETITRSIEFMPATATRDQNDRFWLKADDVVFTKDSESSEDIGVAAYVPQDIPEVLYGYHLSIARAKPCAIGKFLKRYFDSIGTKSYFAVTANGLTRVGLGQYAVDNAPIALPTLEEQIQIARFLDHETAKIDALIAEQKRLIELLKEKRQALISHVVTKGLDPDAPMQDSGVEWLGEVPAHWGLRKFGHISRVVRGGSPRPAGDPELFNGDFSPWVTVAEITKDDEIYLTETETFLTEKGSNQCRIFRQGTLLISNSGATLGVPKILSMDANANDGVVGFEGLSINHEFAYFYLTSLTDTLRERIKQGSGQPNLNTDIVQSIEAPVPPLAEIDLIVSHLNKVKELLNRLTMQASVAIQLLEERRSALISAAVTGKIDVRDWRPPTNTSKKQPSTEAVHG